MHLILLFLFFASGALALGYQVLWSKFLLDFIGVGAYSYSTILAAFMAGLAIGSLLLGKWADRIDSPLKLYAYLELGVGIYAILYPHLSQAASGLYAGWVSFTPEESGAAYGLWAKILASAFLLMPPTILMGGTYPTLLRHITESRKNIGRRASQLYAMNAFGAVFGTLLMTFFLMPVLGMSASLMLLGLCNALVAVVALLMSRTSRKVTPQELEIPASQESPSLTTLQMRLGLALIFSEGLFVFIYEIAWTRYFGIVLGSSTYSFSIMLAAFISGITLGSAWLSRLEKRITNPFRFFGWTQLLVGILVMIPLPFYPYLPWLFQRFSSLLSDHPTAFYLYEFGKLFFCYLIMLPPTIFIGMALPLAIKALNRTLHRLGRNTGRVYAWNTCGNVLGALLAGLFLLPLLGMERLIGWSAIGTGLVGFAAIIYSVNSSVLHLKRSIYIFTSVFIVVLFYDWMLGPWELAWFTFVPARRLNTARSFEDMASMAAHRKVILFHDDPAAHLMVTESNTSGPQLGLYVNGKADASTMDDMATQVLLAQIPLLLHPDPKDVLIIGLASGITSGSALTHPVERVDTVDLVRAMPEATALFRPWNNDPFGDSRFHMIVDDARSYVSYTRRQYDVIVSEPSNPWIAGTGALFSLDFYRRAGRALRPDGIYLQWLQSYEMSDETFLAVVRSFRLAFPYVYAFQANAADVLLLGSRGPIRPGWNQLQERMAQPSIRKDLERIEIRSLPALLFLQRFSPGVIDCLAASTDLENTDDNRLLEYRSPRDLFQRSNATLPDRLDERLVVSPALFWSRFVREHRDQADPIATLQILASDLIGIPPVSHSYQLAYYHLNGSNLSQFPPDVLPLFSLPFLTKESFTETELAERINFFLRHAQEKLAVSVLDSLAPAIFLESLLSETEAQFWTNQAVGWSHFQGKSSRFGEFLIELCAATGQTQQATNELLSWTRSQSPPDQRWALLCASEIDPVRLRHLVLSAYKQRQPSLFLERLEALIRQ